MLFFYVILLVLLIIIIFLFSSPKLSPIPYFPSQPIDMPLIVKALNLKNNQTIIDLGAGDGIVIFKAAGEAFKKKLRTQFVAVEINPILILVLHLRRLFHKNRNNIIIIKDDIFTFSLSSSRTRGSRLDSSLQGNDIVFYLYISPWYLEKTVSNINRQSTISNQQLSIVSYMYPLKFKTAFTKVSTVEGKNKIFTYSSSL